MQIKGNIRKRLPHARKIAILLVIGLMLIATRLLFLPISLQKIDNIIKDAWSQRTDTDLIYSRAVFRLGLLRADFHDVRIQDPNADDMLLTGADHMRLRLRPVPLDRKMPFRIHSVEINGVETFGFEIVDEIRLIPDPQTQKLLDLFARLSEQTNGNGAAQGSLSIAIRNASFRFIERDGPEIRSAKNIQAVYLRFQTDGNYRWTCLLRGRFGEGDRSVLSIEIDSPGETLPISFLAFCDTIDLASDTDRFFLSRLKAREFRLMGRMKRTADADDPPLSIALSARSLLATEQATGRQYALDSLQTYFTAQPLPASEKSPLQLLADSPWQIDTRIDLSRLASGAASASLPVLLPRFQARATSRINITSRTITLDNLHLHNEEMELQAGGDAEWTDPFPYRIEIASLHLSSQALQRVARSFPALIPREVQTPGTLRAALALSGNRHGANWNLSHGNLQAEDFMLKPEGFRDAVALAAQCNWTTATVAVESLSIGIPPSTLDTSGSIERVAPNAPAPFDLRWQMDADLAAIVATLPSQWIERHEWSAVGLVKGAGNISGRFSNDPVHALLSSPSEGLTGLWNGMDDTALKYNADLEITLDDIRSPRDSGVETIQGEIHLSEKTISTDRMLITGPGTQAQLSGSVSGAPWHDRDSARMDIQLQAGLDFSSAIPWLASQFPDLQVASRIHPQGSIDADLHFAGPIADLHDCSAIGNLRGENLRFDRLPGLDAASASLSSIELLLSEGGMEIGNLSGRIGPFDARTSGSLDASRSDLGFHVSGPVEEIRTLFPAALPELLEIEGRVETSARIVASLKEQSAPPALGTAWWAQWAATLSAGEPLTQSLDWNLNGTANVRQGRIDHPILPGPTSNIEGRFLLDGTTLRTDGEARATWVTSTGTVNGEVRLIPNNGPLLVRFNSRMEEATLEDLFLGWGDDTPNPRPRPDSEYLEIIPSDQFDSLVTDPAAQRFIIDGTIVADRTSFQRIRTGPAEAHFTFVYRSAPATSSLLFDRIRADLYEGSGEADVAIFFMPAPQWRVRGNLRDVLSQPLIEALTGNPSTVIGNMTANAEISGRGGIMQAIVGRGSARLANSRFLEDPVFAAVGRVLRWADLADIRFNEFTGDFEIRDSLVHLEDLRFDGPIIQLKADGRVGFDSRMDIMLYNRFLGPMDNVVSRIPILRIAPKIIDEVGQVLIKVHVGGTIGNPNVSLVPLAADEWRFFRFRRDLEPQ